VNEGALEKYTGLMEADHAFFRYDETGQWLELFEALAAEVRALRAERDEIKCKAVEQSEYIQSHGLTEFEMDRLRARVAELQARIRDLQVIHNDAYERSRPTELEELRAERDGLKARVAELETDAANWRKIEAMPMNFRLAHEPVFEFPGDDDWDTKRHYEWAVLYHSTLTSHGATPQEALDRAMKNPQRWVPDYVLTMWREAYLAALEAAQKGEPC
jgi:cell division protein FtsB